VKLKWDLLFAPTQTAPRAEAIRHEDFPPVTTRGTLPLPKNAGTTGTAGTHSKINTLPVPKRIPAAGTHGDRCSGHGEFVPVVPQTETAAGTDNRLKSLHAPVVPAVPAQNTTMRIDADQWAAFEERAAIMEYDGGLSRHEAEARAAELLHRKPMGWA
jgi:hypothetical protein